MMAIEVASTTVLEKLGCWTTYSKADSGCDSSLSEIPFAEGDEISVFLSLPNDFRPLSSKILG